MGNTYIWRAEWVNVGKVVNVCDEESDRETCVAKTPRCPRRARRVNVVKMEEMWDGRVNGGEWVMGEWVNTACFVCFVGLWCTLAEYIKECTCVSMSYEADRDTKTKEQLAARRANVGEMSERAGSAREYIWYVRDELWSLYRLIAMGKKSEEDWWSTGVKSCVDDFWRYDAYELVQIDLTDGQAVSLITGTVLDRLQTAKKNIERAGYKGTCIEKGLEDLIRYIVAEFETVVQYGVVTGIYHAGRERVRREEREMVRREEIETESAAGARLEPEIVDPQRGAVGSGLDVQVSRLIKTIIVLFEDLCEDETAYEPWKQEMTRMEQETQSPTYICEINLVKLMNLRMVVSERWVDARMTLKTENARDRYAAIQVKMEVIIARMQLQILLVRLHDMGK